MTQRHSTEVSDFSRTLLAEQRALLRKAITWLNANRHRADSHVVERWVTREIATLEEASKLRARRVPARKNVDEWLETAGQVGGPEIDQDPTLPHPHAWHGHPESSDPEHE
jgi:hypothetical protein